MNLLNLIPYRRRVKELEEANERLLKIISNPFVGGIEMGRGSLTIEANGGPFMFIAGMVEGLLDEPELGSPPVENWVEVSYLSKKHGPILVTARKLNGKGPEEVPAKCTVLAEGTK